MRTRIDLSSKYIVALIHVLFWLGFLVMPFFFANIPYNNAVLWYKLILSTGFLAAFFYLNTMVFIPKLLGKKKVHLYILSIIATTAAIVYLRIFMEQQFNPEMFDRPWFKDKVITDSIFSSLIVLTIGGGLKITKEWFRNEQMKKEVESEKLQAELALMKSQINPHFLFNTLNNIRSLVRKNSQKSDAAIVKLSQLMRYMLDDAASENVPLEKEIEYLQNYIDLQRLRLSERVDIQFEIVRNSPGYPIPPMLFIPFVENAFKHGVSYIDDSKVDIKLVVNADSLIFSVYNSLSIRKEEHKISREGGGFGLKNIKSRLDILYPKQHDLTIVSEDGLYKVDLYIKIKPGTT